MKTPIWLHTGLASHTGRRPVNQDAALVDGPLLAVADGVGGAPRGDLASSEAISALHDVIHEPAPHPSVPAVSQELAKALQIADDAVSGLADRWGELRGAATTMVAALVFGDDESEEHTAHALVANVGDSRCYHLRGEQVALVTVDHTLANELKMAGVEKIGDRAHHIVTNVLGGPDGMPANVDLYRLVLEMHDVLLLCSDGVWGSVPEADLARIVTEYRGSPHAAAAALVRAAWDMGSTDNITAALAYIGPPPP